MRNFFLFSMMSLLMLAGCSTDVTVGQNGNVQTIVIEESCNDQVVEFAAQELQTYLERMTGYKLSIQNGGKPQGKAFYLKKSNDEQLKWEGYKIVTGNDGIAISANISRGVLYGVYELLKSQGCMFVYPDPDEEIVPEKPLLSFAQGETIDNPVIEHRGTVPTMLYEDNVEMGKKMFDWMAKNRLNYVVVCEERHSDVPVNCHLIRWNKVSHTLLPELQKRGFFISMSEHCTHLFFPRTLYKEHPEWFALINGKRHPKGQICYSNTEAIDYYAQKMVEYVKQHPELSMIGTWPLDGGNYCTCEKCKDVTTVYKAICKIAAEIEKVRPDIVVEHLAYKKETWCPPTEDMPSNMSVLWCPDKGSSKDSLASQWVDRSQNAQGVYQLEYYMGDHYRTRSHALLRPQYVVDDVNYSHEMGFRGIVPIIITIENWFKYGFNCWMLGLASWNDFENVDANMKRFYQAYYPSVSVEMNIVFNAIFGQLHPEPYKQPLNIKKYEDIASCIDAGEMIVESLEKILTKVDDTVEKRRVERIKVYVEYYMMQCRTMAFRDKEHVDQMIDYNRRHSDFREVLINPEYTLHTYKGFFSNCYL